MNFEERKSIARDMLMTFLGGFSAPRGLDDEAQARTVANLSDAFARRLPLTGVDGFRENVEATFTRVRDNHASYAWPPQAVFVEAMPTGGGGKAQKTFRADVREVAERAMMAGDPVPERWIWREDLVIPANVREGYRRGCVEAHRDVYGDEVGMRILEQRYGPRVQMYRDAA